MKPQPVDRLVPLWSHGVKSAPYTPSPPAGPPAAPHQLRSAFCVVALAVPSYAALTFEVTEL